MVTLEKSDEIVRTNPRGKVRRLPLRPAHCYRCGFPYLTTSKQHPRGDMCSDCIYDKYL